MHPFTFLMPHITEESGRGRYFYVWLVTSPTLPYRESVGFPTVLRTAALTRLGFPGYFQARVFHHLPSCAGFLPHDPGRPIAQAVSVPHSPCVLITNRKTNGKYT